MSNLAQTVDPAGAAGATRSRLAGWSLIASGIALFITGEEPFVPGLSLVFLLANVVLFLGMVPAAVRLADSEAARDAGMARTAEVIAFAGVLGSLAAAVLAPLGLLPAVPAEILAMSSWGVIGLWLVLANVLALRTGLLKRVDTVLGALGALGGLGLILATVIMWVELTASNLGSAVATLENIRSASQGFAGELLYLIWAIWLGIWLVRHKW